MLRIAFKKKDDQFIPCVVGEIQKNDVFYIVNEGVMGTLCLATGDATVTDVIKNVPHYHIPSIPYTNPTGEL